MPFALVHARKYTTEHKLQIQTILKLNTTQQKQTTQNTAKQNYPGSVAFYNTRPGNKVWGYSTMLRAHKGQFAKIYIEMHWVTCINVLLWQQYWLLKNTYSTRAYLPTRRPPRPVAIEAENPNHPAFTCWPSVLPPERYMQKKQPKLQGNIRQEFQEKITN